MRGEKCQNNEYDGGGGGRKKEHVLQLDIERPFELSKEQKHESRAGEKS